MQMYCQEVDGKRVIDEDSREWRDLWLLLELPQKDRGPNKYQYIPILSWGFLMIITV